MSLIRVSSSKDFVVDYDKNRIVDVLEISQTVDGPSSGTPFRLNDRTSYVALVILSVNKKPILTESYVKMRLLDMPLYFAAVFAATFLEFVHVISTVKAIMELLDKNMPLYRGYHFFILPSIAIGAVCLLLTIVTRVKNGVKVVLK